MHTEYFSASNDQCLLTPCQEDIHMQLPLFNALGYESGQVSALTELHHDIQSGVGAVNDAVVVSDNVRVSQLPQQIHFRHQHLLLHLCHGAVIQLLPHQDLKQTKKTFSFMCVLLLMKKIDYSFVPPFHQSTHPFC